MDLDIITLLDEGEEKENYEVDCDHRDCMFECLGVDCMNGCQVGPIGSMIFV